MESGDGLTAGVGGSVFGRFGIEHFFVGWNAFEVVTDNRTMADFGLQASATVGVRKGPFGLDLEMGFSQVLLRNDKNSGRYSYDMGSSKQMLQFSLGLTYGFQLSNE
jgi:hypothetical protein